MFCTPLSQEHVAILDHLRYRDMYPIARQHYGKPFKPYDSGSFHPSQSDGQHPLEITFYLILLFAFVSMLLIAVYLSDGKQSGARSSKAISAENGRPWERPWISRKNKIILREAKAAIALSAAVRREARAVALLRHRSRMLCSMGESRRSLESKATQTAQSNITPATNEVAALCASSYLDASTQTNEFFRADQSTQLNFLSDFGENGKAGALIEPVSGQKVSRSETASSPSSVASFLSNVSSPIVRDFVDELRISTEADKKNRSDSIIPFPDLDLNEYNTKEPERDLGMFNADPNSGSDEDITVLSRKPKDLSIKIPEPDAQIVTARNPSNASIPSETRPRAGTFGITPRSSYFSSPTAHRSGNPQSTSSTPITDFIVRNARAFSTLNSPQWNADIVKNRNTSEEISPKTVQILGKSSVPGNRPSTAPSDSKQVPIFPKSILLHHSSADNGSGESTSLPHERGPSLTWDPNCGQPPTTPTSPEKARRSRKSTLEQEMAAYSSSDRRLSSTARNSWTLRQVQHSARATIPSPAETRASEDSELWQRNERRPSLRDQVPELKVAFRQSVPTTPMSALPKIPSSSPPETYSAAIPPKLAPIEGQAPVEGGRRATVSTETVQAWFKSGGLFGSGPE